MQWLSKTLLFLTFLYTFGLFFVLSSGISGKNILAMLIVATTLFVLLVPPKGFQILTSCGFYSMAPVCCDDFSVRTTHGDFEIERP